MRLLGVQPDQSGRGSVAARLQCEAGGYAGCMALAVVRLRANGTEITGTVRGTIALWKLIKSLR